LRTDANLQLREVPVVLLASRAGEEHMAAGFTAGVTDYLPMPCKPTYVRSRVCGWLLRTHQESMAGAGPDGPKSGHIDDPISTPTQSRQGSQEH
jgi:DNA-binding response OmpR family regulator